MTMPDMRRSIGKIAEALAKAQASMEHAKKDANNPYFKSKYADLSSVAEACRKQLAENSIAISQTTMISEQGHPILVTMLLHSSGEWLKGYMPILASKTDAQAFGSALSYARRYALAAISSVYTADDDGETAVGRGTGSNVVPLPKEGPVTEQQISEVTKLLEASFPEKEDRNKAIKATCDAFKVSSLKDMTQQHYSKLLARLKKADVEKTG